MLGVKDKDKDIFIDNSKKIIELFIVFVSEVKNGGYDSQVESLQMRLKLKKHHLTDLLKEFKHHTIEENRLHDNTQEYFKNFKNWLNVLNRTKQLDKYRNNGC